MQESTNNSKKRSHASEQRHTTDAEVLMQIMVALKPHMREDERQFKVTTVEKGTTVGGKLTLKCKDHGSRDEHYVYVDRKFNAPTARELARFLRKNEIEPEFKAIAANAINGVLASLGIQAPRLTVESTAQEPSEGTLDPTLLLLTPLLVPHSRVQEIHVQRDAPPLSSGSSGSSGPESAHPWTAVQRRTLRARGKRQMRQVHCPPPSFGALFLPAIK
jgi:hypothetical protein